MAALREIAAHFGVEFDDKSLAKGELAIEGLIGKVKDFAGVLGGGLALGAIFHFVHGLTEEADALAKQADAMGLSLAEMQEWQYAAMMQGVSAEMLTGVLSKLGSGKFDKGLDALGVKTKETNGEMRTSTDVLEDVADALASIENPAERNRKAVAVLGKSYAKMLPLMKDGSKGIKELREEFQALGGGFTDDFADKADSFGDNIDRIKTAWKNMTIGVVGRVLPTFVEISKKAVVVTKTLIGLFKNSKALETGMIALALKGVLLLSSKIGPLSNILKLLSGNFFRVLLPMLLIEDALVFLAGGDSMIGRMLDGAFGAGSQALVRKFFTDLNEQSKVAMDPNAGLGANLVATGLLMGNVFKQGMSSADDLYRVLDGVWRGIVLGAKIAWTELEGGFVNLAAVIADAFIAAWNKILAGFNFVAGAVDDVLTELGLMSRAERDKNRKTMEGQQVGYVGEDVRKARDMNRAALTDEYDKIANLLDPRKHTTEAKLEANQRASGVYGPPPPVNIENKTNITVTVPAGTPAEQAQAVAKAAKDGAAKGTAVNMNVAAAVAIPGPR